MKPLDLRSREWVLDDVRNDISEMFSNISMLDGWSLEKLEWVARKRNTKSEELKKNITTTLAVSIKTGAGKEIGYEMDIPVLVHGHFFYIGGNLKIPIYQLFDYPILYRDNPKKCNIMFRNNIMTAILDMNKQPFMINIFGKKIDFAIMFVAKYSKDELREFLTGYGIDSENEKIKYFTDRCDELYEHLSTDDRIRLLGDNFTTKSNVNTNDKKGLNILFSLDAAYNVDIYTKKYMETDAILFEMVKAISDGPRSDTDMNHKRLRFREYILQPLIRSIYDMMITVNNNQKAKFRITKKIITTNCNVSNIVHFNFPINPVTELASLMQISLTGPGGFAKDKVPNHLRDIHDSQKRRLCPADTPDRDGCGVIMNIVPDVDVDDLGNINPSKSGMTSYPISLVPFSEHDDQIRLQMASNQAKQSIYLVDAEKPYIKSGNESKYLEYTTFLHKAKGSGLVKHVDSKFMLVLYDNGESEIFRIGYKPLYLNNIDCIRAMLDVDDRFDEGDILCSSDMIKDGELALGRNLLTGIQIYNGFNYEDGIVISDRVAGDKFTSLHSIELEFNIEPGQVLLSLDDGKYRPIPKIGDRLKKGEVCAKIKALDGEDGFESIFVEPYEVVCPNDCVVTDIEIYPNNWTKKISEFKEFIDELKLRQTDGFLSLYNTLSGYMEKDELEAFVTLNGLSKLDCDTQSGKYSSKGKKINGVLIKIKAVQEEPIGIGDKIANRHGNKGIISKIVPYDQMPRTEDGRVLDILINPMGIVSRMNAGQLYEAHLTECIHNLLCDESGRKERVLSEVLDIIYGKVDDERKSEYVDEFMKTSRIVQSPFESIGPEELFEIVDLTNTKLKQRIFDPSKNIYIRNPITVGYVYFTKLVHRSSDKKSARSIGPYNKKTLQPIGGKSKLGGHRLGEYETWSILAHGAEHLLKDLLTIHSDSPGLKNRLLAKILRNEEIYTFEADDSKPQSLRLLESYLSILGMRLSSDDVPDNSFEIIEDENVVGQ